MKGNLHSRPHRFRAHVRTKAILNMRLRENLFILLAVAALGSFSNLAAPPPPDHYFIVCAPVFHRVSPPVSAAPSPRWEWIFPDLGPLPSRRARRGGKK